MIRPRKSEFVHREYKFLKSLKLFVSQGPWALVLVILIQTSGLFFMNALEAAPGGGLARVIEMRGRVQYRVRKSGRWRKLHMGRMLRHGTHLMMERGARLKLLSLNGRTHVYNGTLRFRLRLQRAAFTYNELALMRKRLRASGLFSVSAGSRPGLRDKPVIHYPRGLVQDGRVFISWYVPAGLQARAVRVVDGERVVWRRAIRGEGRLYVLLPFARSGKTYRLDLVMEKGLISSHFTIISREAALRVNRMRAVLKEKTSDEYARFFMQALLLHRERLYYDSSEAYQRVLLLERIMGAGRAP